MSSISPECNKLKQEYDDCFNKWYTQQYLNGDTQDACQDIFKKYKTCVWKAIESKNIDKLINDVVKDHKIDPVNKNE
jgi:TRIAP1/MDM35 family protein